jgi:hypothetical protein
MEERGINPSIHPSSHSSIHPKGEGPYKPYKRPYKPKPSLASVPLSPYFAKLLETDNLPEKEKPQKKKEGHSEQLEGRICVV